MAFHDATLCRPRLRPRHRQAAVHQFLAFLPLTPLPLALLPLLLLALLPIGTSCSSNGNLPRTGSGTGTGTSTGVSPAPAWLSTASDAALLDSVAVRTFRWFWDHADSTTYLTPDRWPTRSFASISATGFALTAYCIGAERGWVTREQAAARTLATLRFLRDARQDSLSSDAIGFRGFYYHFLEPSTGARFRDVELSTQDTALLLAGVLFCESYFDGAPNSAGTSPSAPSSSTAATTASATEDSIRSIAEALYARADWQWAQPRPPSICHGYDPENGFLPYDWRGYNEAMLTYLLALGSPSHPVGADAWDVWTSNYRWGTFQGYEQLGFAPLFGHQYTHVWIDFRGIQDRPMRERGLDYFENSRRAALSQQRYAIENPSRFAGYGEHFWGLTACDGPLEGTVTIDGRPREFHTYWARGASFTVIDDDGTVCPSAAVASIAFAPEAVVPAIREMISRYGDHVFSTYGFLDAVNPTLNIPADTQHGRVVPGVGWFDTDYLGIDQGPILAMIENHRSGLVWRTMQRNPHVIRGLRAAGFSGGWLGSPAPEAPR
ncbi:MAG: glucoamylase family protein [Candidatus Eisenbacteria bacterium]